MERETKNSSSGFSWADEVEKEEREEEQKAGRGVLVQESASRNRKPNPFGAARPREVVLEEKGVDWRKFDEKLDFHSHLRKDNKLKETSISRKENLSLGHKCPVRNKTEMQDARYVCLEQQKQNTNPLVSSLNYPLKNIPAPMKQTRRGHTGKSDTALDNPHQNKHICNSGMEHMNLDSSTVKCHTHGGLMHPWPMDAAHGVTMLARDGFNVERAGHVYQQDMEAKCKRKWYGERLTGTTEEMETIGRRQVLVDLNMEQTSSRTSFDHGLRNYVQEFIGASGELQANGRRRVLVDHNMESTTLGRKYKDDEEFYWGCIEDGTGRKNYDTKFMKPPMELDGWRHNQHDFSIERCRFGGSYEDRSLGLASEVTDMHRGNDSVGKMVGHLATPVINRGRTRKARHTGERNGDNCSKNGQMLSSSKPCPSHRRRRGKQPRK